MFRSAAAMRCIQFTNRISNPAYVISVQGCRERKKEKARNHGNNADIIATALHQAAKERKKVRELEEHIFLRLRGKVFRVLPRRFKMKKLPNQ